MPGVLIRGEGVAAYTCAHLLDAAGIPVAVETAGRPKLPAILLGEPTQQLICDVFDQPALFDGLPRIERRVVAWGADPVTVPHRAVVISETDLAARLGPACLGEVAKPGWTIYAKSPLPAACTEHEFGHRSATVHKVSVKGDTAALWIESVADGWLFLIPQGWLLAVGAPAEELLARSQLVAAQIQGREDAGGRFAAHPRVVSPLCGPGWLGCGAAALSFDPICGDGTGYAIREGILAAAVIRAAERGEEADGVRSHYAKRVVAAYSRHLELCREYYRTGGSGPWWESELNALEEGVAWCRAELGRETFQFRLNGFELERAG